MRPGARVLADSRIACFYTHCRRKEKAKFLLFRTGALVECCRSVPWVAAKWYPRPIHTPECAAPPRGSTVRGWPELQCTVSSGGPQVMKVVGSSRGWSPMRTLHPRPAPHAPPAPLPHSPPAQVLADCGVDASRVRFVSCDFAEESWMARLREEGFDPARATCFIWEGVTMYLTRAQVEWTLRQVTACAPGSVIGFDYLDAAWALAPALVKAMARLGEPWQFGMAPAEAGPLVEGQGLQVAEHVQHAELAARYLPKHADGRPTGYLDDFGGFLLATRA